MSNAKIREQVTSQLVELIQAGNLFWRRRFKPDVNAGLATSLSSRKKFNGINQLLLQYASLKNGYQSKWWGSFNAIKKNKGFVKRGAKASWICLFKPVERTRVDASGTERKETFFIYRQFAVFNAEQAVGLDDYLVGNEAPNASLLTDRYSEANRVITATNAKIVHGNQPCYSPLHDTIWLPAREQFETPEAFFETAYHELTHWSCNPSRLNPPQKEGRDNYAFYELVSELSSCFLMAELQLEMAAHNHAAYLQSWLQPLKDTKFLFEASGLASRCADYILSFSRKENPTAAPIEEALPF